MGLHHVGYVLYSLQEQKCLSVCVDCAGCLGAAPPEKKFYLGKCDTYLEKRVMYLGGFIGTWFFLMAFYFWLSNQDFGLIQVIGLEFWMPLDPICILHCKQCNTMNEYNICWFSRFGFPGEKYLCNVCIFYSFTKNLFAVNIVQG